MSFLLTLDEERLEEIIPLLPRYEQKIQAAEPIFKVEGRRLEEVMRTLPHYQSSYDQSYQEMKGLEEWILNIKEKKVGKLWKKYNEGYSRQLSTKDITMYIASEKEIVELNQIIIEVVTLKNNLEAIVEALKQLGWMVGHITKLRVSEMQDAIL
jgi:hypothetical protein